MCVCVQLACPAGSLPPGLAGPWGLLPASDSAVPPGLGSAWALALVLPQTPRQPSVWPPGSRCEPVVPRRVSTCLQATAFPCQDQQVCRSCGWYAPWACCPRHRNPVLPSTYFALGVLHKQQVSRRKEEFPFDLKVGIFWCVLRRVRVGSVQGWNTSCVEGPHR